MRWRRRIPPEFEAPDPGVPAFGDWSRRGIVGTIGSGLEAGGTVAADPVMGEGGRFAGYWLLLPVPDLYTESGGTRWTTARSNPVLSLDVSEALSTR